MYDNVLSVLRNRWVQALGALLVLAFVIFLIRLVSPLLTPILLALLASYLLFPVVRFFERHTGWKRFYIATGLMFISISILLLLPIMLISGLNREADRMINSGRQQPSGEAAQKSFTDNLIEWLPMKELVLLMNWDVPVEIPEPAVSVQPEEAAAAQPETTPAEGAVAVPAPVAPTEGVDVSVETETPVAEAVAAATALSYNERSKRLTEREAWRILSRHIGLLVKGNVALVVQQYSGQVAGALHAGGSRLVGLAHRLWNFALRLLVFLVNFSIFAFATVYLLVSYESLTRRMREIIPRQYKKKTLAIVRKVDLQLRSFVRGQLVVAMVDAVVYCVGLSIAGVPFAIVIGLLAGFLSFVPYLGVMLGLIPSVILVLITHDLDWHIVAVILTFVTVQTLEEIYLRPVVLGDKVGLHPVWVMASFLVFGNLLGFLGILMAVPIAAILKVFVVEGYHYYRKSKLYGSEAS